MKRYAPMGKQRDKVFAKRAAEDGVIAAEMAERADHYRDVCETLVSHAAFREWFTKIMLDFGGIEMDRPMTDIAQGEFIMLARLRDSLKTAKGAPALFGEIMKKHYERIAQKEEK